MFIGMGTSSSSQSRKAARVAALYLVFSSLWIFASDRLLTLTEGDPELLVKISMAKGLAFVAVTTLLLYLLLRFWGDSPSAAMPAAPQRRKLVGLAVGMLLIVPLFAFSIVRLHAPHIKEDTFSNLRAIASLKANQVEALAC